MSSELFPLSCTKSCSNACFFFAVCRAPNRAPMLAFFFRFVVHQIGLQCVFFFAVCRAPNRAPVQCVFFFHGLSCTKSCSNASFFLAVCRAPSSAPMRAFICGLSCAKSCCMVSIMLKVCALVIILVVLWKWKKCGKTKNWRFVLFSSSELRPGSGRS